MTTDGKIRLEESTIVYQTSAVGNSFELPLVELKAIFKYQDQEKSRGYVLMNHQYMRKYVPIATEGLTAFLTELAQALKMAEELFVFSATDKELVRIFFKPSRKNYQILPDSYVQDQNEGYEIIGPKSIFCKWDTTIEELEKLGVIKTTTVGRVGKKVIISYPVRIGGLLIDGLEITSNTQRNDYPVKAFYAKIVNAENTENSFYETYACLKQGAQKNVKQSEQFTQDYLQIALSLNDIVYKITYTLSGEHNLELGYSSLFIENNRIYYDRLRTFDQLGKIDPTTCHFFQKEVRIYSMLSNNELIGVSPRGLWFNSTKKASFWVDEKLALVGFSQGEYSYIFELSQVGNFTISNIRPARGRGRASLAIDYAEGKEVVEGWLMLEGDYQSFDKSVAVIEAMSGKTVQFAQEWVDD